MDKSEFLERLTHAYRLKQFEELLSEAQVRAEDAFLEVPLPDQERTPDAIPDEVDSETLTDAYEKLLEGKRLLDGALEPLWPAIEEARKPFEVLTTTEKAQLILDLLPEEDSPLPPERDLGETEQAALQAELRKVKEELDDLRGLT
jgi:hypothetical protein